jgi:hypothetical protein
MLTVLARREAGPILATKQVKPISALRPSSFGSPPDMTAIAINARANIAVRPRVNVNCIAVSAARTHRGSFDFAIFISA